MSFSTKIKGFTLIELIIVIAIIGILASIVVVAINPARQFANARDTQRKSDVTSILSAIGQYQAENDKYLSGIAGITISPQTLNICKTSDPCPGPTGLPLTVVGSINDGNIDNDILPTYISNMPTDPRTDSNGSFSCTYKYDSQGNAATPSTVSTNLNNSTGYLLTVQSLVTPGTGAPYKLTVWSPCSELAMQSATR